MENGPLFRRCAVVILHATLFDEEGRAEVGPNLVEQSATAGQQLRHFIRRRHNVKAAGRDVARIGGRLSFGYGRIARLHRPE
jgi:hypothetical protein